MHCQIQMTYKTCACTKMTENAHQGVDCTVELPVGVNDHREDERSLVWHHNIVCILQRYSVKQGDLKTRLVGAILHSSGENLRVRLTQLQPRFEGHVRCT